MVTGRAGAFKVGTSGISTTTIGTWVSQSIKVKHFIELSERNFDQYYSAFASPKDQDIEERNLLVMDTEGLNHQTELGDSYDVVTITPNTLIAENVFLIVLNRAKPREIMELISVIAKAAEKAHGGFEHRNGRPFGRLTVVVNKCQENDLTEEAVLQKWREDYPSLLRRIRAYFNEGPRVVILPTLHWDANEKPAGLEADNFFLTFDHIRLAQKVPREKMMTGLAKISEIVIKSSINDFALPCEDIEDVFSNLYQITTGAHIDVNELDYQWSLKKAEIELHDYITKYDLKRIGLDDEILFNVCPRMDKLLFYCYENFVQLSCYI